MPTATSTLPPITFIKSPRAKRLSINIEPFKPVRVTIPKRTSYKTAKKFLKSNLEWVKKTIANTKKFEQEQEIAQLQLSPIDKNHSKTILTTRLNYLAHKYKFSYKRTFIRNQKTLWGSCSPVNNINLNLNLIRLPQELIDYVILHELAHTVIKSHGKRFWNKLDKYVGNAKIMDKRLGSYDLRMFHRVA